MASRIFPDIMNKASSTPVPMIGFHAVKISNDSNVAQLKTEATGQWSWLPVPPDGLSTAYPQGWDEQTASAMGSGISQLYSKFFESHGAPPQQATAGQTRRGNSEITSVEGVAGTALDVGIEKAKAALGAGAGINQRVLEQAFISYSGPGYRSHTFSFSLKPESKKDAENIKAIVQFFKFYSAPELLQNTGGLVRLYNTPHLFTIMIAPSKLKRNLFLFKASALTDLQVKYGGEKFNVTTDDNPTSVDLSLSFKEMSILSQIDVTTSAFGSF
jgi:hypothetical protein